MTTKIKTGQIDDGAITGAKLSLSSLSTSNVTEGSNLYFTNTRSRTAISVSGSGSYDNSTGVITITGGVSSVGGATGAVSNTQLQTSVLPPQTGNANAILKTSGTTAYWTTLPTTLSIYTNGGTTTSVSLANGSLPVLTYGGSTTNVTVS